MTVHTAFLLHKEDGSPANSNIGIAREGFEARGIDCKPFTMPQLWYGGLGLDRETLVFGGVGLVTKALSLIGVPVPEPIDYPESLDRFYRRKREVTTLSKVRERFNNTDPGLDRVFMKPVGHKLAKGRVVAAFRDLIPTAGLPGETPVHLHEVKGWVSEWRVYVLKGEVIGVGHYTGDPLSFPNPMSVMAMVEMYEGDPSSPVAYGIDIGVHRLLPPTIVEVNDAHSLGNYGLHSWKYAEMLISRWEEMVSVES